MLSSQTGGGHGASAHLAGLGTVSFFAIGFFLDRKIFEILRLELSFTAGATGEADDAAVLPPDHVGLELGEACFDLRVAINSRLSKPRLPVQPPWPQSC